MAASMPARTRSKIVAAGDGAEALAIQGIEVNVQAAQTGVEQRPGSFFKQHAVGGES